MGNGTTAVEIGDSKFDLAAIGDWIGANIWLCLLVAAIVFIFWIFRKGAFAEKLLDYRIKQRELDAKRIDDAKELANILTRKYDRDDPLLPFPDDVTKDRK